MWGGMALLFSEFPGRAGGFYYVHIRYLCEKHLKWKWNENNWSLGNEMGHYVLINLVYISVDSWVPWSCGTMAAEGGGFTEWQDYSEHKGSGSDSRTEMFCQCSRWKDQLPNFFLDLDIISASFFFFGPKKHWTYDCRFVSFWNVCGIFYWKVLELFYLNCFAKDFEFVIFMPQCLTIFLLSLIIQNKINSMVRVIWRITHISGRS